MKSDPRIELVEKFFSGTGSSYDQIVNLFTLGIDKRWKETILQRFERPRNVLDLACGTGILTLAIARRFPHCRVVGVELRDEYLSLARKKARELNMTNIEFILGRAEDWVVNESFDHITSSYLAKYADLKILVGNLTGMLREGGLLVFHDFTYPANRFCASGWELYFKILQSLGTRKYPEWENVFYGLPELLRQTRWVQELQTVIHENALSEIKVDYLTLGASAIITARKI
jgi:demethylmenaquinone methyltransferase / 2-methoxy-6-polyprenyl-1,4-benzoquinol methylase